MENITLLQPYILATSSFRIYHKSEHLCVLEGNISKAISLRIVPFCNNVWIINNDSTHHFINLHEYIDVSLNQGPITIIISDDKTGTIRDNSYILKEFISLSKTSENCAAYINMLLSPLAISENAQAIKNMIIEEAGYITIDDISAATGYCNRHINRIFTNCFGYGPKDFSKAMRIANVISEIIKEPSRSNLEFITNSGYSDQAHFQREFKKYMGETPREFIRRL